MKHYAIGSGLSHLGNLLALADLLSFLYQKFVVVRIGAEIFIAVFDDNKLSVTAKSTSLIDDAPRRAREHRGAELS